MNASLGRLRALSSEFGAPALAQEKVELMQRVGRRALSSARALSEFHECLCFLRAYPDDARVLAEAERWLDGFAARADLRRFHGELADTGIAGTDITYPFFAEMALWLAERWPDRLHVVWDEVEDPERIEGLLGLIGHYAETPYFDEWTYPMRRWCELLSRPGEADGAFLVKRLHALGLPPHVHEWLYQELGLVLRLTGAAHTPSRSRAKRSTGAVHFQRSPLDRSRPRLEQALGETDFSVRDVAPAEGRRWIDLAREALVTRSRDLDAFSYGDPNDVRLIDFGDGLVFAMVGVNPQRRLLLEAVYAFLTLHNGVPIGYVLNSALFGSAEVAYNVFESFRGGESAKIYGRVLAMLRRLFGADTFAIYPYQLGDENEEGLRSGAWWFYQKLGFRAKHAPTLALMQRELARQRARPKARSSRATLQKLARENVYYHAGKTREDVIGVLPLSHVGAAVSRSLAQRYGADLERGARECEARAQKLLGARAIASWTRGERLAFERWAPLVTILPGIERWSKEQRKQLLDVVRAKGARRESEFVARFDRHARLRQAIVELCRQAPPEA